MSSDKSPDKSILGLLSSAKTYVIVVLIFALLYSFLGSLYYIYKIPKIITDPLAAYKIWTDYSYIILSFFSFLVSYAAGFFSAAAEFNLTFFDNVAIATTWSLIRDYVNGIFIIVLVFAAFKLIYDSAFDNADPLAKAKKTFIFIFFVAVFINFSLLFTRAFVETTNVLALAIIKAGFPKILVGDVEVDSGKSGTESISIGIFANLGFETLLEVGQTGKSIKVPVAPGATSNPSDSNPNPGPPNELKSTLAFWSGFLGAIFLVLLTLFFLQIAIILVFRIISIFKSIILSPIAFVSLVIPAYSSFFSNWLKDLTKASFIFPALVFWLYLIYFFLTQLTGGQGGLLNVFINSSKTENQILDINIYEGLINFSIIIALLLYASRFATRIGDSVSNAGVNTYNWIEGKTFGAAKIATGTLGRSTIGRYADTFAQGGENTAFGRLGKRYRDAAPNSILARTVIRGAEKFSDVKFGTKETFRTARDRVSREISDRATRRGFSDDQKLEYYQDLRKGPSGLYNFVTGKLGGVKEAERALRLIAFGKRKLDDFKSTMFKNGMIRGKKITDKGATYLNSDFIKYNKETKDYDFNIASRDPSGKFLKNGKVLPFEKEISNLENLADSKFIDKGEGIKEAIITDKNGAPHHLVRDLVSGDNSVIRTILDTEGNQLIKIKGSGTGGFEFKSESFFNNKDEELHNIVEDENGKILESFSTDELFKEADKFSFNLQDLREGKFKLLGNSIKFTDLEGNPQSIKLENNSSSFLHSIVNSNSEQVDDLEEIWRHCVVEREKIALIGKINLLGSCFSSLSSRVKEMIGGKPPKINLTDFDKEIIKKVTLQFKSITEMKDSEGRQILSKIVKIDPEISEWFADTNKDGSINQSNIMNNIEYLTKNNNTEFNKEDLPTEFLYLKEGLENATKLKVPEKSYSDTENIKVIIDDVGREIDRTLNAPQTKAGSSETRKAL